MHPSARILAGILFVQGIGDLRMQLLKDNGGQWPADTEERERSWASSCIEKAENALEIIDQADEARG